MSGTTLSANPTTITGTITGTVPTYKYGPQAVLYGPTGTAWTLVNQGDVSAGTTGDVIGVFLNGTSGDVTNAAGALISADETGIDIPGTGTVINRGTIISSYRYSAGRAGGIYLGGGYISNASSGLIEGGYAGINVYRQAVAIANAGTIDGTSGSGIDLRAAGGTVTNASTGLIEGARYGAELAINQTSASLAFLNGGRIEGTGSFSTGLELSATDSLVLGASTIAITNASAATIAGVVRGLYAYVAGTAAIDNFGLVEATGSAGTGASIRGGVTLDNESGATIQAIGTTTVSSRFGLTVGKGAVATGGSIDNAGVISGESIGGIGISLAGSSALTNSGLVLGYSGGIIVSPASVVIDNSGTIEETGGAAGGSGPYSTYATDGIFINSRGSVAITNATNALIAGYSGGLAGIPEATIDVLNEGTITAASTAGIGLYGAGTVSNAAGGIIGGGAVGVSLAGYLLNAGTIEGGTYAVQGVSTLVVDPGAVFEGEVLGRGAGYNAALVLAGTSGSGMLTGFGSVVLGFRVVNFSRGADWSLEGAGSAFNAGTFGAPVFNDFHAGDSLVLTGVTANGETFSGGLLTLTENGAAVESIALRGSFGTDAFALASSSTGITITTDQIATTKSTISGSYALAFNIYAPNYANPVTVTGTIAPLSGTAQYSVNAMYALAAGNWTVDNEGLIGLSAGAALFRAPDYGIVLGNGLITNAFGATIAGSGIGVEAGDATIFNAGLIEGGEGQGVRLEGGFVSNAAGATIQSAYGLSNFDNGYVTVINAGSIIGTSRFGVEVSALTNASGGLISGYSEGALVGHVLNQGQITATSNGGIGLETGEGTVINAGGAWIGGGLTGLSFAGAITISNQGTIAGGTGAGISGSSNLMLSNAASAVIEGGSYGVIDHGANMVIDNLGEILATSGIGITLGSGAFTDATITNAAGALISGAADGIVVTSPATLIDAGTIEGGTGAGDYAVEFTGGHYNLIDVIPGASFTGAIDGGDSVGSTYRSVLELGSGATAGTIGNFINFTNIDIDPGASWTLDSSLAALDGVIRGFSTGDVIDLLGVSVASVAFGGGTLTLENGSGSVLGTINLAGAFTASDFSLSSDGAAGTDISLKSAPAPRAVLPNTYGFGVYLSASAYIDPTTLTGAITAGGLYPALNAGTFWSFVNEGQIVHTDFASAGTAVYFENGGYFRNAASASVDGVAWGVVLDNSGISTLVNGGLITAAPHSEAVFSGGAYLFAGTVTNAANATIAAQYGVEFGYRGSQDSIGVVINAGVISGRGARYSEGIYFYGNGTVANLAGGTIFGDRYGIFGQSASTSFSIYNAGLIASTYSSTNSSSGRFGIELIGVAAISNASSGTIIGAVDGIKGFYTATSLNNAGLIEGNKGYGVETYGTVINTGQIIGYSGASIYGGPVTNMAQIIGSSGFGAEVGGGPVTNVSGALIQGSERGLEIFDGTALNEGTIVATGSGGIGVLLDDVFTNAAGATVSGAGYGIVANYSDTILTLVNAGTIAGTTDAVDFARDISAALLIIDPGAVFDGDVAANGATAGTGIATLELAGSTSAILSGIGTSFSGFGALSFAAGATWTAEGDTAGLAARQIIAGFAESDTIVLDGFVRTGDSYVSGVGLELTSGASTITLGIAGSFTTSSFDVTTARGDTWITLNEMTCFSPGTLIRTARGEVKVEELVIGDRVATVFGGSHPVKWIGHRCYAGRFVVGNHLILPIHFAANSMADGVPARDLYVSPGHGMFVDGALVPAWRLINGVSIMQAPHAERIEYYHIELDQHDIIFAENCPAESFYGEEFRMQFQNAAEFYALYPDAEPAREVMPRTEDGFVLDAIQRRLAARAGIPAHKQVPGALRGYVDQTGPTLVYGWAQDEAAPEQPVCLDILVDRHRIARVLANRYRADLREAGLGSGCHAFELALPAGVTGLIEVRRVTDGCLLALTETAARILAA